MRTMEQHDLYKCCSVAPFRRTIELHGLYKAASHGTADTLSNMATRWGICSAGKISHDFTVALKSLPDSDHKVSV